MKPILFNTEMVRAILDGRKTVTRRAVKLKYDNTHLEMKTDKYGTRLVEVQNDVEGETFGKNPDGTSWRTLRAVMDVKQPYKVGDILYVRETWNEFPKNTYHYRADWGIGKDAEYFHAVSSPLWRSSIHMPKEAARIFLRVTSVRVEKLQDITAEQCIKEGITWQEVTPVVGALPYNPAYDMDEIIGEIQQQEERQLIENSFGKLWDITIKSDDLNKYGWNANPWVWVIEFERCEKPQNCKEVE